MKRYKAPAGRAHEIEHKHPERTAAADLGTGLDFDVTFQVWPSRAAMALSVRMQERSGPSRRHWRPLVPLGAVEGY